jgi:hypothetical protein
MRTSLPFSAKIIATLSHLGGPGGPLVLVGVVP